MYFFFLQFIKFIPYVSSTRAIFSGKFKIYKMAASWEFKRYYIFTLNEQILICSQCVNAVKNVIKSHKKMYCTCSHSTVYTHKAQLKLFLGKDTIWFMDQILQDAIGSYQFQYFHLKWHEQYKISRWNNACQCTGNVLTFNLKLVKNTHRVFVDKHERKAPVRRHRHRCNDNIQTDL